MLPVSYLVTCFPIFHHSGVHLTQLFLQLINVSPVLLYSSLTDEGGCDQKQDSTEQDHSQDWEDYVENVLKFLFKCDSANKCFLVA